MWIVIIFLASPALYLAAGLRYEWRLNRATSDAVRTALQHVARRTAFWGALGAAAAVSVGVIGMVWKATAPSQGAEVVWTGVRAGSPGAGVRIGGGRETATVQWPEGRAWPVVRLESEVPGQATVSVSGGGGFVTVHGEYANGSALQAGSKADVGPFTVEHSRRVLWFHRIRVHSGFRAVSDHWQRLTTDKVIRFSSLVVDAVNELRATGLEQDAVEALRLETWAARTLIVRERGGQLRVLGWDEELPEATRRSPSFTLPASLEVRWPSRTLPTRVALGEDRRLRIAFLPPWRSGSPIPPEKTDDARPNELVVTSRPRPGDYAFQPPIGFAPEDPRARFSVARLVEQTERMRTEAEDYLVPGIRRTRVDESGERDSVGRVVLRVEGRPADSLLLDLDIALTFVNWRALMWVLFLGYAFTAAGCYLVLRAIWRRDIWVVNGVALAAWSLLNLRLLLAIRYSLDPQHLDAVGVLGVSNAAGALIALPVFYFAVVRLWRDFYLPSDARSKYRRFMTMNAYLVLAVAAIVAQTLLARHLWPGLPDRLAPPIVGGQVLFGSVLCLISFAQNLYANVVGGAAVRPGFWPPLHAVRTLTVHVAPRFWTYLHSIPRRLFLTLLLMIGVLFSGVAVTLGQIGTLGSFKAAQDIVAPILLVWLAVMVWVGWRVAFDGRTASDPRSWWRALGAAVVLAFIPIFFVPGFLRDVGAILATLAVFLPLAAVLFAARASRPFAAVVGAIALGLGLTALFFTNVVRLGPEWQVGLLERGISRYVVFSQGPLAQRYLPSAEVAADSPERVTARSLQGAIEHTWENASMVHEGGLLGLGFDAAPNRRSMVPQTVLQYDSTYSFFIAAEHGSLGGIALTLLYCLPLAAVLWSGHRRYDVGHALATIIAASLVGEALVHIGANLRALPFTGRNLPLLSVLSLSDLFRWTLLLAFLGQSVLWRGAHAEETFAPRAASILVPPGRLGLGRLSPAFRPAVSVAIVLCGAIAALQIIPTAKNLTDTRLDTPFGWDEYLRRVNDLIRDGKVWWDPARQRVTVSDVGWVLDGRSLLEQEVARFNALPDDDKFEDVTRLNAMLAGVASLADYDRALDRARLEWERRPSRGRPSLFRLTSLQENQNDRPASESWQLEVNPDYNIRLSFKVPVDGEGVPSIRLSRMSAPKDHPQLPPLLGLTWVNGRVGATVDVRAPLPWAETLAAAMQGEWKLSRDRAAARFSTLTLDYDLQHAAMEFVAKRGRALHEQLVPEGRGNSPRRALPPRLALSVISLPAGHVIAMGGWPRPAIGGRWLRDRETQEWLPPAAWLEQEAPPALRLRYLGDRNFDLIEMGSATKPVWAAAVLAVHPSLHRQLRVRGSSASEQDVFGIPLPGKPWQVSPVEGWVDFDRYLARSDNRYQIRLGFAGLAEADGRRLAAEGGVSPSTAESLDGRTPSPWRRYPRFSPIIGFSKDVPGRIENLHQTPLAEGLRRMFGVSVGPGDRRPFLTAFWTGREADEWPSEHEDRVGAEPPEVTRLAPISPPATVLGLDAFGVSRRGQPTLSPRNYVDLLLGGGANRWSNVTFAAGFATALTGHPVVARITPGPTESAKTRTDFPDVAKLLRPGLHAAVMGQGGTATAAFLREGAAGVVKSLRGVRAYAKTGTIVVDPVSGRETSRMALALVLWKDEAKGEPAAGLVFSVVAERATQGYATNLLGRFIVENRQRIREHFQ